MNRRLGPFAGIVLGAALLPAAFAPAQQAPLPEEKTGPKIGEKAPPFELEGADGQVHSLADLLKQGKVALVFYRSANW